MDTVLKFYKTVLALQTLLYGSEMWTLRTQQTRRTEASRDEVVKTISRLHIHLHIVKKLHKSLVLKISSKLLKLQTTWYEYVLRMGLVEIPHNLRLLSGGKTKHKKGQQM
jgi:hypothetical protein